MISQSIDFNGNTGPFIQYTHARIRSIIRKAKELKYDHKNKQSKDLNLHSKEISIIKLLHDYPEITKQAAELLSPAIIANYTYELAREYNQFYHDHYILGEADKNVMNFRLVLTSAVGSIIQKAMSLLGIEMPERM